MDKFFRKIIGPDLKVIMGPLFLIILTSMLFIVGINTGYSAITKRVNEYKTAKNVENGLTAKLDILEGVEAGSLERSNLLVRILPDSNSGALVISQSKLTAGDNLLEIGNFNLNTGSESSDDAYFANLKFDLTGINLTDTLNFLTLLNNLAPINNLENVEIEIDEDGIVETQAEIKIYWADYPKTIAAVDTAITDLDQTEIQSLNSFGSYVLPTLSNFTPNQPSDRENPFN